MLRTAPELRHEALCGLQAACSGLGAERAPDIAEQVSERLAEMLVRAANAAAVAEAMAERPEGAALS